MFSCQGQGTSENLCISSTPSIRCHGETHPNRTATPPSILGPCHTENELSLKSWWHLVAWPCLGLPLVLHFLTCNPRSFNVHQSCSLQPTVITAPFIRKAVCLHSLCFPASPYDISIPGWKHNIHRENGDPMSQGKKNVCRECQLLG